MLGTRDGIPFIPTVMDFKQAAVVKEIFTFSHGILDVGGELKCLGTM